MFSHRWQKFLLTLPPGANFTNVALGWHNTAAATYVEWDARTCFRLQFVATAAIAAHTQIFDIVGAPKLRSKQQFEVIACRQNTNFDANGSRKHFFDACEQL